MKYELINNKTNEKVGVFYFLKDAENEVLKLCLGSDKFSIFDFNIKEVDDKPQEPNEQIKSFEDAVRFLGINEFDDEEDLLFAQEYPVPVVTNNESINRKINAYTKLLTIATAWNKIDGFVADWKDTEQRKFFPWFEYSRDSDRFAFAGIYYSATDAYAYFGSRFCFKTRERATQFGKQFIDLWNDLLQ